MCEHAVSALTFEVKSDVAEPESKSRRISESAPLPENRNVSEIHEIVTLEDG